jgi:hypothetical protein
VPYHTSFTVCHFVAKNQIPPTLKPQYSPDQALCNFWLFLTLKIWLKGNCFACVTEIQQNTTAGLTAISKEGLKTSSGASSNGRTAGATVYVQKACILTD